MKQIIQSTFWTCNDKTKTDLYFDTPWNIRVGDCHDFQPWVVELILFQFFGHNLNGITETNAW